MFINSPPSLPMHYIWKEGPICLFNGVIDKRRYYAHRHAILALRGDEIEPTTEEQKPSFTSSRTSKTVKKKGKNCANKKKKKAL